MGKISAEGAFVCVGSPGDDAPRLYGLAEEMLGLRAVLVEQASADRVEQLPGELGRVYRYGLLSPEQARRTATAWLRAEPGRQVDVLRHREGAQLTRVRVTAEEAEARIPEVLAA